MCLTTRNKKLQNKATFLSGVNCAKLSAWSCLILLSSCLTCWITAWVLLELVIMASHTKNTLEKVYLMNNLESCYLSWKRTNNILIKSKQMVQNKDIPDKKAFFTTKSCFCFAKNHFMFFILNAFLVSQRFLASDMRNFLSSDMKSFLASDVRSFLAQI